MANSLSELLNKIMGGGVAPAPAPGKAGATPPFVPGQTLPGLTGAPAQIIGQQPTPPPYVPPGQQMPTGAPPPKGALNPIGIIGQIIGGQGNIRKPPTPPQRNLTHQLLGFDTPTDDGQ